MNTLITVLAVAGGAAAAWHALGAALQFLRATAAGLWTKELARNHARRGDVTALDEARRERASTVQKQVRAGAVALGWLVLLIAPALTPWGRAIYASYMVLWAVPALRSRFG